MVSPEELQTKLKDLGGQPIADMTLQELSDALNNYHSLELQACRRTITRPVKPVVPVMPSKPPKPAKPLYARATSGAT